MQDRPVFLRLPALLIIFILANVHSSAAARKVSSPAWPYNLPADAKYYPEHESLYRADASAKCRLQTTMPMGIQKMSGDPGQKFFLDMWMFGEDYEYSTTNDSTSADVHACFRPIVPSIQNGLPRWIGIDLFKRDFQCPSGSSPCTSINKPDACCQTGSTCQLIEDTGIGDVGCCPANQVCAGSVSTCPSGYSPCPQQPGGGCCIPGYSCFQSGCLAVSTATISYTPPTPSTNTITTTLLSTGAPVTITQTSTVIVNPTTAPSTSTSTSTTSISSSSTAPPSPTTQTNTATSVVVPAPTTTITTTTLTSSLTCSPGYKSCPASLGGGCCPTDRACGSNVCPPLTTSNSLVAPARGTSNTASTTTSTLISDSNIGCPTGFYACSAVYGGGCCQTGRECDVTSCPASAFTVVQQSSNSITIVASSQSGISSAQTVLTGNCRSGWSSCPSDDGGGCCPSGYACGTACTATGTAAAVTGQTLVKIAPNGAGRRSARGRLVAGMIVVMLSIVT